MKTIKKKLIEAKRVFCFILACVLCVTAGSSFVYAKEEDSDQGILVEGEDYSEINFELYEYEKDPGLSGGDFLLMKAPAGAVPPEEGFLAKYEVDVEQAGTYQMDMTCLAINGNLGSTIEVRINDGDFKPYSEENAVNHGGVDGEVYKKNFFHYTLDTVPLRSGKNTVTIKIADTRTTDNRYYFFLDCMNFYKMETPEVPAGTLMLEGENYTDINFKIPAYDKDPALSGSDFLCLKSYADNPMPEEGYQAVYQVEAAETALYDMRIVSLTLDGNNGSAFEMKVNDGEYVRYDKSCAELKGIVDSSVYRNSFEINQLPPVVLEQGLNTITIKVTEARNSDARQYFYLDYIQFTPVEWNLKGIEPVNGTVGVYEEGETPLVHIEYSAEAAGVEQMEYRVVNFWEEEVLSDSLTAEAGTEMEIRLPELEKGHYMVYARAVKEAEEVPWISCQFAVVTSLEERMQEKPENSPFALDAAMLMTYYKTPGFNMETALQYADALALAGVDTVRERYRWNDETNPAEGEYNFDAFQTDEYLNRLKEHGIKVLNMYDSSPDWAKTQEGARLVGNLQDVYQFSKDSAVYYEDVVNAWEMANEPELGNTMTYETADRLAAYIKAASIGYADSGAAPLVSIPGLAYTPQYYADLMLQNDVLKYVDIYNYHNHVALDQDKEITYPSMIYQAHQNLLDQYGGQNKEIWVSEAGTYVNLPEGGEELTHRQQIQMAKYLVVSTLTSLAEGTDKHFYFNLTYLVESGRELGIFGTEDTPYAPFSAEAALTETFGEAVYLGNIAGCAESVHAYAFKNGEDTVIGIWSDTEELVQIPASCAEAELVDMMGGSSTVSSRNGVFVLTADSSPKYLVVNGAMPDGTLVRDYTNSESADRESFTKAERVILEQKYTDEAAAGSKMTGYSLKADEPNEVSVEVTNLNNETMTGTIEGKGYQGWTVAPASAEVTVEPYSKTTVKFEIKATDEVVINTASPIQFTGDFNGEKTTNCVAHVQLPGEENPPVKTEIPGSDTKDGWQININTENKGICTITDGDREGSVTFANTFEGGDRWTYPVLQMPEGTDFTGTKGLTFHVDSEMDFADGSVAVMRVLITEKNGNKYWTADGFSLKKGEQQITIPWTDFSAMAGAVDNNFHLDLDQITAIELGLNSRQDTAPIYTVWDFGTYDGNTEAVYPEIKNLRISEDGDKMSVQAEVSEGMIRGKLDTLRVTLNGKDVQAQYDEKSKKITAEFDRPAEGKHELDIQFFCEDGKGVLATEDVLVKEGGEPGGAESPDIPGESDTPGEPDTEDPVEMPDSQASPQTGDRWEVNGVIVWSILALGISTVVITGGILYFKSRRRK